MGNPEATREYWRSYRRGRADALFYGLHLMLGDFPRERFEESKRGDFDGYMQGIESVHKDWLKIEER